MDAQLIDYKDVTVDKVIMIELAEARMDERYFLRAFICDGPCTQYVDQIGSSTFTEIFIRRPSGCRYAVIEPVTDPNKYMVVDLYDSYINGQRVEMGRNLVFPTLSAAMAARQINYET